jgi:hypothetical protein
MFYACAFICAVVSEREACSLEGDSCLQAFSFALQHHTSAPPISTASKKGECMKASFEVSFFSPDKYLNNLSKLNLI